MKIQRLVAMSCLLVWVSACAPAVVSTEPAPPPTYLERVAERVSVQMDQAVHRLRHNPTPCGCPPFELLLVDHWHRVTLDADEEDEAMVTLMAAVREEREAERDGEHPVQGGLSRDVGTCGRGAAVVTLELSDYGELEVEPGPVEETTDPPPPAQPPQSEP